MDADGLLASSPRAARTPRHRSPAFWVISVMVGLALAFGVIVATAVLAFRAPASNGSVAAGIDASVWHAFATVIGRRAHAYTCGDSFYEYSCSADADGDSTFVALADRVDERLAVILSERWPIIGTWFAACMNVSARRAAGLSALQPLLDTIDGVHSVESFSRAVARLHRAGAPALFLAYAAPDELAPTTAPRLFYLDALDPLLPAEMWTNNGSALAMAARARVQSLVIALLGDTLAAEALSVDEQQLAPRVPSPAARRSAPPAQRDVEWDALPSTAFNWSAYAEELFVGAPPPSSVAVVSMDYLSTATELAAHNDWGTVRAYLLARLAVSLADDLPTTDGNATEPVCAESVENALGDLLGHYYVRECFDAVSAKPAAAAIVSAVISAFERRLAANAWMDGATRAAALAKAAAIRPEVAFPDGAWPVSLPTFEITEDDHLANVLAARADSATHNIASVGAPPPPPGTEPHWLMSAFVVNAYYSPPENDIVFPAGILQGSFFHVDAPLAVNYGGLGAVAGHEITHAFDDQGREYDGSGARRDWWTAASAAAFERRAACVVDLYAACPSDDGTEHVNGELTLGENLADLGGLPTAFDAYLNALNTTYPTRDARRAYERSVRSVFGMTHEQLFFAAYAHTWCTRRRSPDLAYLLLHTDPHSPPRWRVDVPTSQTAEFARVFQCPAPAAPCAVW